MLVSIKKVLVSAGVIAISVALPAVASGNQWKQGGSQFNGTAYAGGTLTATLATGGSLAATCNVVGSLALTNTGSFGDANGSVTNLAFSGCTTPVPACTVTAVGDFSPSPWPIQTTGPFVTFVNAEIAYTFAGASCSVNGLVLSAWGFIDGTNDGWNTTEFSDAGPLSSAYGPVEIDGELDLYEEFSPGSPYPARPILLW